MAGVKRPAKAKPDGEKAPAKKPRVKKPSPYVWPGVRVIDPFTGKPFHFFLQRRRLKPGNIPLADIRRAVRQVRDERLARERAAAEAGAAPE